MDQVSPSDLFQRTGGGLGGWGGGDWGGPHLLQGPLEGRKIRQQPGPVQVQLSELGLEGGLGWVWGPPTSAFSSSQLHQLSSSSPHRRHQPTSGLQVFGQVLDGDQRGRAVRLAWPRPLVAVSAVARAVLTTDWTRCFWTWSTSASSKPDA